MKKIILTLALMAGLAGGAHAQRSIRERSQGSSGTLSWGAKAGATLSNLVGSDADVFEDVYGFHAGGFANITLSKHFALQPELLYSQKGAQRLGVGSLDTYVTRRFHYLDIPLAVHFNANGFFLEAGPQLGFLLAVQDKFNNPYVYTYRNDFKAADIGYIAGLGYQRKAGLGFGFRYNGELTNVPREFILGNITSQEKQRNSAFQLYLTYSFNGQF